MRTARCVLLLGCLAGVFANNITANDPQGNWPIEISLGEARRPIAVVGPRGTFLFVATVGGQIWRVDVKGGSATMINRGGDGQSFAGMCADERTGERVNGGTLYACGRESGKVYAFDYDGNLLRTYQVTDRSTSARPHFIASCITTRYKLIITDAFASAYIWFPLKDKGPKLGLPPPLNLKYRNQGILVEMAGQWPAPVARSAQLPKTLPTPAPVTEKAENPLLETEATNPLLRNESVSRGEETANSTLITETVRADVTAGDYVPPRFGAFGVEFTSRRNTTGYICHSSSGKLFAFKLNSTKKANMEQVLVVGAVRRFPGAMGILFDDRNELIMYICIPSANVIAVIEFDQRTYKKAKFIRFLTASLLNGPVDVGAYGTRLYPISGMFKNHNSTEREELPYTMIQIPRHEQQLKAANVWTTDFDDQEHTFPSGGQIDEELELDMLVPPRATGQKPPSQKEDDTDQGKFSIPSPSPKFSEPGRISLEPPSSQPACFPATARINLADGSKLAMVKLRLDDTVRVPNGASALFSFTHADPFHLGSFVRLQTDRTTLTLSAGHYVYVDGKLLTARSVRVGHRLEHVDGGVAVVESIYTVLSSGLYAPHSLHGDLFVDGIRVSSYTDAIHPKLAHRALAPFRWAYRIGIPAPPLHRLLPRFARFAPPGPQRVVAT